MLTPVRLFAVVTSVLVTVLATASAGAADAPTTWEATEGLSGLEYLGLLVGIPAALFGVIWLFALLTARRNYVPPAPGTEIERVSAH
ncbi:hypothetical protein HMPREF0063_11326 [Aeromicrobium marinum DSM 15272]|uniref:Tat pathway signal sequence domain protein n=1 Tax=Aeromicrobium marinum DSM 15272 TaxID=585531 RepID=E2SBB7_9ACTN|nr:hypothetical protein [Aeromicrobium marinum]EFQ83663.1 hypothetical protein HMPREF0063_11326 [Aeromicrobium marinum DSM 15272]